MPHPNPFGQYLIDHNLGVNDFPFKLRGIVQRLKANAKKVAPNSPLLELLADHLKAPLDELQRFAEAPDMPPKWVKKIRVQIERDSIPRGEQTKKHGTNWRSRAAKLRQAKKEKPLPKPPIPGRTPFAKLAASKGVSLPDLAGRLGVPIPFMWRVSTGAMAKNHPVLEPLAKLLHVEVSELKRLMKKPAFGPGFVKRSQRDLLAAMEKSGGGEPTTPGTAVVKAETNGAPIVGEIGAAGARTYNRLGSKRSALKLRESVRAMVATLNVSVMRGDTHMPPIPIGDLYLILQDYLQEKGIRAIVLIDPTFPNLFDPKA